MSFLKKIKNEKPSPTEPYLFSSLFNKIEEEIKPYGSITYNFFSDFTEIKVATGGWSENEEIIMAMQENLLLWGLCWYSSTKGGAYTFRCKNTNFNKDFELVLSGGGALGYVHYGLLKALNQYDKKPSAIHGVSMGAILSALYASPGINNIEDALFDIANTLKWIRPSFTGKEMISSQGIEKLLTHYFKNYKIGDAKIPLYIYATNFNTGKRHLFSKWTLIKDAVYASMSIPSVFPKKIIEGSVFVDGYISGNVPLSRTTLPNILVSNAVGKNSIKKLDPQSLKELSATKSLERSVRLLMKDQFEKEKIIYENDKNVFVIDYDTSEFKTSQFWKKDEIVKIGYETAKSGLKNFFDKNINYKEFKPKNNTETKK